MVGFSESKDRFSTLSTKLASRSQLNALATFN
jgi:hypothetical protein